jgi:hypothetical protein
MDYDLLISCEEALTAILGSSAEVDGHDWGASEMNMFILSNEPEATFERVKPALQEMNIFDTLRAAYRHIEMDDYTILAPKAYRLLPSSKIRP